MKRKNIVISLVIIVCIFAVSFGVRVEKPFPIENWVSDEAYAMALEKIDTFAEELKGMDLDGIRISVWYYFVIPSSSKEIWIDYGASAEEIKSYLMENIPKVKLKSYLIKNFRE